MSQHVGVAQVAELRSGSTTHPGRFCRRPADGLDVELWLPKSGCLPGRPAGVGAASGVADHDAESGRQR
jgi:hypothetical protein